jgi:hypothetical protein
MPHDASAVTAFVCALPLLLVPVWWLLKSTRHGEPGRERQGPVQVSIAYGLVQFSPVIGIGPPLLGEIAVVVVLVVALMIICIALFGSPVLSERAFRLLRRPDVGAIGEAVGTTKQSASKTP